MNHVTSLLDLFHPPLYLVALTMRTRFGTAPNRPVESTAVAAAGGALHRTTLRKAFIVQPRGKHEANDLLPVHLARRDISVTRISVAQASADILRPLKARLHVGISTQVSSDGRLQRLALASSDAVLLISVEPEKQSWLKMRDTALAGLLQDGPVLVGFGIAHIALQIHHDIRAHISNSVDLSTLCSLATRETWSPSKLVGTRLCSTASFSTIDRLWYGGVDSEREVVLRAWISAMYVIYDSLRELRSLIQNSRVAEPCAVQIAGSLKELSILGNLVAQADALAAHKTKETPNDFIRGVMTAEGMDLENARYKNRVRRSHQTSIIMTNESGREFTGRADGVQGRLTAVRVVGKEELTNSEKARDEFILLALRGELKITDARFIRLLWLSEPEHRGEVTAPATHGTIATRVSGLNASQTRVLHRIISTMPIVIVQGPPGTGKTKTISAAAAIWEENGSPVWIVAQSNVAVKNIAQKLAQLGVFFKIVVSQEFYVEW
ncbi:hypothetical protein B0H17DRAFT_1141417 [Mycena rosella]|uniref:DNA2/NAM7 helicase helicase domain-containing protein n=1 Tax=Mycena rosella TaxID=1033263 RepID=A0AAD7CZP7_MYCRO|nr:hypothetical protein B0H17DRAFT_1141417 [Mycena rosella]